MTMLLERPVAVSHADAWENVRAITVRQPWAEVIAAGVKTDENRAEGFPKAYRGPLLLHAGAGWSVSGGTDPRILRWAQARWASPIEFLRTEVTFSAVLAVVECVDIHPAMGCCRPWGEETYLPANPEDRAPGQVTHLVFEDVRRLGTPVPASGALGLWRPSTDLTAAVRAQLP